MKKLKWELKKGTKEWCSEYQACDATYRIDVYECHRKKNVYSLEISGHHIRTFKKLNDAKKVAQLIYNG